jgi:hypothetical protein
MEYFRESSYCIGVSQKLCLSAKTSGTELLMQNAGKKGAEAKGLDWMDDAGRTATDLEVAPCEAHVSFAQVLAPSALSDSC